MSCICVMLWCQVKLNKDRSQQQGTSTIGLKKKLYLFGHHYFIKDEQIQKRWLFVKFARLLNFAVVENDLCSI